MLSRDEKNQLLMGVDKSHVDDVARVLELVHISVSLVLHHCSRFLYLNRVSTPDFALSFTLILSIDYDRHEAQQIDGKSHIQRFSPHQC